MKNSVIKLLMLLSFAFVLVGGSIVGEVDPPVQPLDFPDQH